VTTRVEWGLRDASGFIYIVRPEPDWELTIEQVVRKRVADADGFWVAVTRTVTETPWETAPPEPAYPLACIDCSMTYDACTARLHRSGKCCCSTCHVRETHNQHTWEAWDRRQRTGRTL
jgi:hypothetical protein